MKLLPKNIKEKLPKLYSSEGNSSPMAVVKFFDPYSNWTWYVIEGEQRENDFIFYGLVFGFEKEFGYFNLSELESVLLKGKPRIERDMHFKPTSIREIYPEFYREFK